MTKSLYAIGLGSNRPHGRHGGPAHVLAAAIGLIGDKARIVAVSPMITTPPLGPSRRRFANAAALIETDMSPPELLTFVKNIERGFGRRRGQRWSARVIDLDLLLWSGGRWRSRALTIPHAALAQRGFVLDPLVTIAPDWRLPGGALAIRHLRARLTKRFAFHRGRSRSGP